MVDGGLGSMILLFLGTDSDLLVDNEFSEAVADVLDIHLRYAGDVVCTDSGIFTDAVEDCRLTIFEVGDRVVGPY